MRLSSLLRGPFGRPSPANRRSVRRLVLEPLEDRFCPSDSIIDLGTLGGAFSEATAVNTSGQVAGRSYTAGGDEHAFSWQDGVMTDLGTLGGTVSVANDLNNAGQVVGYAYVTGNSTNHAFVWQSGVMTDLGAIGGGYSSAEAINNVGQIVGYAQATDGVEHALVWENGVMYDLNALLPAGSDWQRVAEAYDINDNGQIVGWGIINGKQHAFRMSDPDGVYGNGGLTITDLGTLGGSSSSAAAINSLGQVAGSSQIKGRPFEDIHAFLSSNGTMTDLKTLGGPHSWAKGINDAKQVVGVSQYVRNQYGAVPTRAFLWQNGKMTDLNKLLPSGSGWTLSGANDINNVGWIVGAGAISGQSHAFLTMLASPLQAESVSTEPVTQTISMDQVQPHFTEALSRWQAAGADASSLGTIAIRIADLGGTTLGLASGNTIWLDDNAAGWGWFIDPTPWDDSEFTTPGNQGEQNRMDLLTVLMHEIGHVLGHEHDEGGVMAETLTTGTRLTPLGDSTNWLAAVDVAFSKKSLSQWK